MPSSGLVPSFMKGIGSLSPIFSTLISDILERTSVYCERRSESDTRWRRRSETGNESDLQNGFVMAGAGTDGRYRMRRKEPEGRVQTHPARLVSGGGDAVVWMR